MSENPLRIELYDNGDVVLGSPTHMTWLDADMCVVDDDDMCQRGDHPTPNSECHPLAEEAP